MQFKKHMYCNVSQGIYCKKYVISEFEPSSGRDVNGGNVLSMNGGNVLSMTIKLFLTCQEEMNRLC